MGILRLENGARLGASVLCTTEEAQGANPLDYALAFEEAAGEIAGVRVENGKCLGAVAIAKRVACGDEESRFPSQGVVAVRDRG